MNVVYDDNGERKLCGKSSLLTPLRGDFRRELFTSVTLSPLFIVLGLFSFIHGLTYIHTL
jgi:hypothetical protein